MHNAEYITCQENTSKRSVFRRIHETQSVSTAEKRDHAVRFIWHAKSPKAKQQTAVKWLIRYEWHN